MLTVAFSRTVHTKWIVCFATAKLVSQRRHNVPLYVNCFSSSVLERKKEYLFSCCGVDCVWNVMAHAQKPDFVFRQNRRVHLNRQESSVQSTTGSRGMRISGSNAGYIMFRGSVKSTGYPLHSPVSPSLPFPCVTVCHHISAGLCNIPRCRYFGINL